MQMVHSIAQMLNSKDLFLFFLLFFSLFFFSGKMYTSATFQECVCVQRLIYIWICDVIHILSIVNLDAIQTVHGQRGHDQDSVSDIVSLPMISHDAIQSVPMSPIS